MIFFYINKHKIQHNCSVEEKKDDFFFVQFKMWQVWSAIALIIEFLF